MPAFHIYRAILESFFYAYSAIVDNFVIVSFSWKTLYSVVLSLTNMLRLCQLMLNVVVKMVAIFGVIYRVPSTTPAHNVFCYSAVVHILTHWCGRRGCKHTPKSFDLVEFLAKSFKSRAKSLKTFTNSVKVWAKMAPNIVWFEKTCAQFLGKFVRIRAKIIRTPKNLPAPTPMS